MYAPIVLKMMLKKHLTMTVVVRWYFTISLFLVRIDDVDEVLISYLHL